MVGRRTHLHDIAEIYAKLLEQWLVFLWTRVLSLTESNDADNSDGFTCTVSIHGWFGEGSSRPLILVQKI